MSSKNNSSGKSSKKSTVNFNEIKMSLKRYIRKIGENRIPFSIALLVPSVILLYLSFGQHFLNGIMTKGMVDSMNSTFGDWSLWFVIFTPITTIIALGYLIDTVLAKKKFLEAMEIQSRSLFRKQLSDIELAATKLPDMYWEMLENKKKQFKI